MVFIIIKERKVFVKRLRILAVIKGIYYLDQKTVNVDADYVIYVIFRVGAIEASEVEDST